LLKDSDEAIILTVVIFEVLHNNIFALEKPLFLYEAPLLRHQSPVGGQGALGYNDSDILENV